jgi:integral membrane protein (TIGR00529 family)
MVDVLKIGLIIAGIIVLIRFKVALSLTLFASALVLGLLFQLSAGDMIDGVLAAALSVDNLKLVLALQFVLLFSALLKENGSMARAIAALSCVLRDARFTVAIIPAVVGLLPVVGGAMLSAPLVGEASDELRLSPERRTFLNFWFRHVWEFTLPTFPAVFLTASISGVPVAELVAVGVPLTLAAILSGAVFGFQGVKASRRGAAAGSPWRGVAEFVRNLLPFFVVILLTVAFDVHLVYPMAAVTVGVILCNRTPFATVKRLARAHLSLELALLIWGIMVFKEILMRTRAMEHMAADLSAMGIPVIVLIVLVPALIAFITGYTTAFVGLSFPVLAPFIGTGGMEAFYVMLGLASGICAHMLSPMHACLVMTLDYYEAPMGKTYRLLYAPVAALFLAAIGVFAAGSLWFG